MIVYDHAVEVGRALATDNEVAGVDPRVLAAVYFQGILDGLGMSPDDRVSAMAAMLDAICAGDRGRIDAALDQNGRNRSA